MCCWARVIDITAEALLRLCIALRRGSPKVLSVHSERPCPGPLVPSIYPLPWRRYLVLDLSAGPATYGPLWCTEGAVGPDSLPRIRPYAIPVGTTPGGATQGASGGGRQRGRGGALGSEYLLGALSSVLVSATEHLLSPDIR